MDDPLADGAEPDPGLQQALVAADEAAAASLSITAGRRGCAVLDLATGRAAWVHADARLPAGALIVLPLLHDLLRTLARGGPAPCGGDAAAVQDWLDRSASDPALEASELTARDALRWMLLLEQGRLVDPERSAWLGRILDAPVRDLTPDGCVLALAGRERSIRRIGGVRGTGYAELARIGHRGGAYLLAVLCDHPAGEAYAGRIAAAADSALCGDLAAPPLPVHRHHVWADRATWRAFAPSAADMIAATDLAVQIAPPSGGEAGAVSPELKSERWFDEVLLSWNIERAADAAFAVELRVARSPDPAWSPWLRAGGRGDGLPGTDAWDGGAVDVDVLRLQRRVDRLQVRVRAAGPGRVTVRRLAACLTDRSGLPAHALEPDPVVAAPPPRPGRIPVPFRSQHAADPALRKRVCSPASVAMVLEHHGIALPLADVARRLFDAEHDLYGNWTLAVQGAFELGIPGYLARFRTWTEVEALLAAGQPLVISIGVKPGQLRGAPYERTNGHLLVLVGVDPAGDLEVNDPAAETAAAGQTVYRRSDLEEVWMRRGGTAYVLLPPPPHEG